MKKIIALALFAVIILSGCIKQKTDQTQPIISVPIAKEPIQPNVATSSNSISLETYVNKDYGFEFKYPSEFGNLNLEIFSENIRGSFSKNQNITISGITKNYQAEREGFYVDFREFKKEGDNYFWGFVGNDYFPITPKKIISQDIIMVDCMSFKEKCKQTGPSISIPEGKIAGLINLKNDKFKGLILIADKDAIEEDEFIDIISTFNFQEQDNEKIKNISFDGCGGIDKYKSEFWYSDFIKKLSDNNTAANDIAEACLLVDKKIFIALTKGGYCDVGSLFQYDVSKNVLAKAEFNDRERGCVSWPKKFGDKNDDIISLKGFGGDAGCSNIMYYDYSFIGNKIELKRECDQCEGDKQETCHDYSQQQKNVKNPQ